MIPCGLYTEPLLVHVVIECPLIKKKFQCAPPKLLIKIWMILNLMNSF